VIVLVMAIQPTNTGPTSSTHATAVIPDDDTDLASATKGLWVGGTGDVKVTMFGGEAVTFVAVPAGTYLPICVTRVWDADTTATDLLALWE
jgi:hypothetical protein